MHHERQDSHSLLPSEGSSTPAGEKELFDEDEKILINKISRNSENIDSTIAQRIQCDHTEELDVLEPCPPVRQMRLEGPILF